MVADYDDGMRGIIDKAILGRPTPYRFESAEVKGVDKEVIWILRERDC